jgi:hypothetical protein
VKRSHDKSVHNGLAYSLGLVLGTANSVRHRFRGYRTPRPFSPYDFERAIAHDLKIVALWRELGEITFERKRILELGPGSDLGTGAAMVADGAKSYLAVDVNDLLVDPPDSFWDAFGSYRRDRLAFLLQPSPTLPDVRGPFDLIVSNATLNCVKDLDVTFARLAELSAHGCRMVHHVDTKIHTRWFRRSDPFNHLRYSDRLHALIDYPGGPNRLLADDYVRIAENAAFRAKIVPEGRADPSYLAAVRTSLASPFRFRDDLELLSFTLVCDFNG